MAQLALGVLHTQASAEPRSQHVADATAHYGHALNVFQRREFPVHKAAVELQLGDAYRRRAGMEDRQRNLERAANHYAEAERLFKRQSLRFDMTLAQLNHYVTLAQMDADHREHIDRALAAYQNALPVLGEYHPLFHAAAQLNLGSLYRQRKPAGRQADLEAASAAYRAALHVFTRQAYPLYYGLLRRWQGYIHQMQGRTDDEITEYDEALNSLTERDFPLLHAEVQTDRGRAYLERRSSDPVGDVKVSAACFDVALRLYDPQLHPEKHQEVSHYRSRAEAERRRLTASA
jgi:tetratricopeptide (TPR) repeat protein